jgi:zinc transporter 1/2/3
MLDTVLFQSTWSDPGATAWDDVDGNLTSVIQTFGAAAVDTSIPTAPDQEGYVVEYAVQDKSRNAAPLARRLVKVVCGAGMEVCIDADTGKRTCRIEGACGAQLSAAVSNKQAAAEPPPPPRPPRVTLLGPGTAYVPMGAVYDRCSPGANFSAVCDQGVVARDFLDGNMERQVLVCGTR